MTSASNRLRLAFGRINQETNALSPVATHLDDFTATHFVDGVDLLKSCDRFATELQSMFRNAELSGFVQQARKQGDVDVVPLLSAWAAIRRSRAVFSCQCWVSSGWTPTA